MCNSEFLDFLCYSVKWNKCPTSEAMGNFELLLDEEVSAHGERDHFIGKLKSSGSKWK